MSHALLLLAADTIDVFGVLAVGIVLMLAWYARTQLSLFILLQ